nr:immunoglobulin heavy chain junction region [Mus musculus]
CARRSNYRWYFDVW